MKAWAVAVVLLPLAAASVQVHQDVAVTLGSQDPLAPLVAGDIGTATIGASGASASVDLGSLPLLSANDILRLDSSDAGWQVHAELVSQSGWGVLESITVSLADGLLTEPQIVINLGSLTKSSGLPVDLPSTGDTEVRVIGSGGGTMAFDLVLTPDGGGPEVRYAVSLTV